MIIVAGGDSFVWGIELADCKHTNEGGHSQVTWPARLAKQNNFEYQCVAQPGAGNDTISRNIIKQCEELGAANIAVIVQWTFPWRFEFCYVDPIGWVNFDLQVVSQEFNSHWADKEIKKFKQLGILEFAQTFYKLIGTHDYWQIYSTFKEILLLQGYLKSKNIPYLFSTSDDIFYHHTILTDVYIKNLYNQIDQNNWYLFPPGTEANETITPRGFYQWAVENKNSIGPGHHPLEQAHCDAADLIKDKFNELVIKNIQ